jgi:hypothetical protein
MLNRVVKNDSRIIERVLNFIMPSKKQKLYKKAREINTEV